jgi:hypothetical protein
VERYGERAEDWSFRGFGCTRNRDEVEALTEYYPKRWHVEEFFNAHQAQGWERAGTMNLNIRYGQMTLALKLMDENIPAEIPWLYGYKLDFAFR